VPQEHRNPSNDPAEPAAPSAGLARVVAARTHSPRDLSIVQHIQGLADTIRGADAGLAQAARAWASVVPPELARACTFEALSRGVLRVRVKDASVRFELDRFLRAGGEARVIGASGAPIRSVRLQS
jgi:hypothetical protein